MSPRSSIDERIRAVPSHIIRRAKNMWKRGESIATIRAMLGTGNDGGTYQMLQRWGCQPRDPDLVRRLRGRKRNGQPANDHDTVQPFVRQTTPERRCGRCGGYTDSNPCHRCGEPYGPLARRSA